MTQSGARGERFLEAAERRYAVLFTNRALAEAERALEKPIIGLLTSASNGDVSISNLARLLQVGIEHGRRDAGEPGPQLGMEDAWRILDEVGVPAVIEAVFLAIADVLSYRKGEEKGGNP
jgi:hypothetical protein